MYGKDIELLSLDIIYHTADIVEVKITDAKEKRWEIPSSIIPRHSPDLLIGSGKVTKNFDVTYTTSPFSLQITRLSDNEIIFSLDSQFIFKDQYLEFSLFSSSVNLMKERNTFGFGESTRLAQAHKVPSLLTLWAADVPSMIMSENLYGSYPFFLQQIISEEKDAKNKGSCHGGLLLNSNGMDIALLSDRINWKVIGGIFDFFVFARSSPKDVISQSTEIIGKPAMIPYWTLGFHNCRWGYQNIQEVVDTVSNYSLAGIPLETQWFDIDYMNDYRDFTVNETTFSLNEVQAFVKELHNNGQKLVPILDPGIRVDEGYNAYDEAIKLDLFIRDMTGQQYYSGQVWPGVTYFPDFLHPQTQVIMSLSLSQ
jgi:alpha-glucosidase (family GH31 glycosyl hydrolase)